MPGFDRSGPSGAGPMTGRALGQCAGSAAGRGLGRGYGPGRGCGRGLRAGNGAGFGGSRSVGPGRGLGWFSAGYGDASPAARSGTVAEAIQGALKDRAAALRAELARTEAMLNDNGETATGKDSVE